MGDSRFEQSRRSIMPLMKKLSRILFCIRNDAAPDKIERLFAALPKELTCFLDEDALHLWRKDSLPFPILHRDEWSDALDAVVVIGGDGTLLKISPHLAEHAVPVIGINRGRLGFMTDIAFEKAAEDLSTIFSGAYQIEKRALLEVSVLEANGMRIYTQSALNDAVINAGSIARMIEFEVFVDERAVYRQRADGLIVSTPTGSTAYALSAGGPIIAPELDVFLLVPMFPHSLSCRPLLISATSHVSVKMYHSAHSRPALSADGWDPVELSAHAHVHFAKKPQPLLLIHPLDYDYFQILRDKLHWSSLPNYSAGQPAS